MIHVNISATFYAFIVSPLRQVKVIMQIPFVSPSVLGNCIFQYLLEVELCDLYTAVLDVWVFFFQYFYFPLRFNCILPEEVHAQLFSNIEQIKEVNTTLLELMEQSTVGQAFKHLGPFLKLYSMYANNHEQALTVLQVRHCARSKSSWLFLLADCPFTSAMVDYITASK